MSYRNDVDALAARKAALDAEVDARTKERDETARMLAELHARAKLPILPNIRIATPCTADWNAMTGDERVRHCASCDKDVFNLSAMTRAEAEALVVEKNADLCARYYQRKDGTILLADCEVGRAQQRRLKLVGAGLLVTITAGVALGAMDARETMQVKGAISVDDEITAVAGGMGMRPPSTGIPECDSLRESIYEVGRCEALGLDRRKVLLDAFAQAEATWIQSGPLPADARAYVAKSCVTAARELSDSIRNACPPPIPETPTVMLTDTPTETPTDR